MTGDARGLDPNRSLWIDAVPAAERVFESKEVSSSYDVVIVGGGLTGLWTAWYLSSANPRLRTAVFEACHVGFGASGRSGGWVLGLLDHQAAMLRPLAPAAKRAAREAISSTVDEVGRVVAAERIECGYHKGGMLRIAARHPYQMRLLHHYVKEMEEECGPGASVRLNRAEAAERVGIRNVLGGAFFPTCAVVNPAQLACGLAQALRRRGVEIHEQTAVTGISPRAVKTTRGACRAGHVVLATECYSNSLPILAGRMVAVYGHILATEPLTPDLRAQLGLRDREAFSDTSSVHTYGQVTADGRLVFGATGSYPKGGLPLGLSERSKVERYALAHRILVDAFPFLHATKITHAWSGALGLVRAFRPTVIQDRTSGVIFAGGYAGRGMAASNLFGRTVADLITTPDSPLVRAPWTHKDQSIAAGLIPWERGILKSLGAALAFKPGEWKERIALASWPAPAQRLAHGAIDLIPSIGH